MFSYFLIIGIFIAFTETIIFIPKLDKTYLWIKNKNASRQFLP